ncbi:MAG: NAD-dependent epimerase/dehydratase family protein [Acidobacteria bacterium]|nr:NAD-dependent epimerase/dehydratase family protein [Acidobacteriota bacterium]
MSEKSFLVTGARGFIGAWVVKRLLARGAGVVALDQNDSPHRWRLIMSSEEMGRVRSFTGDITEEGYVHRLIAENGVEGIIHLAGLQVPTCRANPRLGALVNVIGTINVFEGARLSGGQVGRVAYASSAAVFGAAEDGVAVSEKEAGGMSTHYGAFKRCNEDNARVYHLDHGIDSAGLRPLTVYGVGRDTGMTSDPTKAMKAAVAGLPFHIRFGGRTDFLYVADCADAFIKAATVDLPGARVFNLHGETVALSAIVATIEDIKPTARGAITVAEQGIAMPTTLDDSAIQQALGGVPRTSMVEGIAATMARFEQLQQAGELDLSDLAQ